MFCIQLSFLSPFCADFDMWQASVSRDHRYTPKKLCLRCCTISYGCTVPHGIDSLDCNECMWWSRTAMSTCKIGCGCLNSEFSFSSNCHSLAHIRTDLKIGLLLQFKMLKLLTNFQNKTARWASNQIMKKLLALDLQFCTNFESLNDSEQYCLKNIDISTMILNRGSFFIFKVLVPTF